jgi:hypothetical protein
MERMLTLGLSFYWFIFWLFNGLDKYLPGTNLGLFTWGGKDRTNQFAGYLDKIDWSQDAFIYLMFMLFVIEIIIALAFLRAIVTILRLKDYGKYLPHETMKLPILLSILCFTGFSLWDVIVGDRAELWEHGTYIVALGTTWIIASFETLLDVVPRKQYDGPERRLGEVADRRQPDLS